MRTDTRVLRLDERTLGQHRPGAILALAVGGAVSLLPAPPANQVLSAASRGGSRGSDASSDGGSVAIVSVLGALSQRAESGVCGGYVDGYDAITSRLASALNDRAVDAVVLRIDSPGGDTAGLEEAVRRMRSHIDGSGKPVVAYVDELAASAAYWIAAAVARDGVYAPGSGRLGSIGTLCVHVDESAANEQEGYRVTFVRDPAGKANPNSLEPLDELGKARLGEMVRSATARFVAAVSEARGIESKAVLELNAEVLSASEAVEKGLADGVASFEDVIERAASLARERKRNMDHRAQLAAMAGLAATCTDDELSAAMESTSAAVAVGRAVLGRTSAASADAAIGIVAAWQTDAAGAAQLRQAEKDRLEAEALAAQAAEKAEGHRIVSGLVGAGLLSPARAFAPLGDAEPEGAPRRLSDEYAAMSIGVLRSFDSALRGAAKQGGAKVDAVVAAARGVVMNEAKRAELVARGVDPDVWARAHAETIAMLDNAAACRGEEA